MAKVQDYNEEIVNSFVDFAKKAMERDGKEFIVNADNGNAIRNLSLYFAEDETTEYNLKKGIYLMGTVGTGKSKLMELLNKWPSNKRRFNEVRSKIVQRGYTSEGFNFIQKYGSDSYRMKNNLRCREKGYAIAYCFDDLGEEKSSKSYGTEALIMEDVIQDRWVEFESTGMLTHFTTNILDGDLVQDIYGIRVRDRIRGMCNTVKLNGKSFRV